MSTTPSTIRLPPLSKFSEVRPRPTAWLWQNWLPLGKLAILEVRRAAFPACEHGAGAYTEE
jgi:hypothetical protein